MDEHDEQQEPPPWQASAYHPAYGYDYDPLYGGKLGAVAEWGVSPGGTVRVSRPAHGVDAHITLQLSGTALREAEVTRKVTREQVEAFARHLLQLVDEWDDLNPAAT